MKTIANKQTEVPFDGGKKATYANLLSVVISQPQQGGYTIQDIRIRTRLLDIIEQSDGNIEIEDADFAYLKPLLKSMNWPVLNKELITFFEDIDGL